MAVFKSIAFQAEISRFEDHDPDFVAIARRNCNEDPSTRNKAITEFRKLIQERGEVTPRRDDDAYLLRFLRCRRYIPKLAHKLLVRYENFRLENAYLYDCHIFKLDEVRNVYGGMLPDSPVNGRVTFMRFGRWDPNEVPIVDVVRCALVMDELAVRQPKLQVLGVTIVVDLEGLGIRHVRHLTPTIAYQIVSLMGVSFPLLNHSLHVINYNWFLNTFFYVFKQFIPRAAWDRLFFHGCDLKSLHKFIEPQYLPPEYGGTGSEIVTTEEWLSQINRYKDDVLVQELRDLGFTVEN